MQVSARVAYVRGRFCPLETASIPIMDRGFLFGDGAYEVTAVVDGRLVDNTQHLQRLERSLRAIDICNPNTIEEWTDIQQELIHRNRLSEGLIYLEVTRGAFERNFTCPGDTEPTVVMFTQEKDLRDNPAALAGVSVITVPDLRWKRRDIKSVALLPQVLAKFAALKAGAEEAWMTEDGFVTEGASSSVFIVTEANEIVTRPSSSTILPGITRRSVMTLIEKRGMRLVERTFTVGEALSAREAFQTSASSFVLPVVKIDDVQVGDGKPGPVALELRRIYISALDPEFVRRRSPLTG